MKRSTLNFCVDFVTLLVFLGMAVTGLLVRFLLPPGTGGRLSIWSWGRHDWGDLHFWLAVGLLGLIFVHLILHWAWICQVARNWTTSSRVAAGPLARQRRFLIGIAALVVITASLVTFYLFAAWSVKDERGRGVRAQVSATMEESPDQHRTAAETEKPNRHQRNRIRGQNR